MGEDDEIVEKVNNMNTEFYRAFEKMSIEMMDNLWKHDEMLFVFIQVGIYSLAGWQKVG